MQPVAPLPEDEAGRVLKLSEYDLDYSDLSDNFKDLLTLAAKTAGTGISLVNLLDSYTQWTVSSYGLDVEQMPREDSVCQYVVAGNDHFEVKDLSADDRFKDKDYVAKEPELKYYYGVPIKTADGHALGALCVLDQHSKSLSPEKIEMLELIAAEIVNRLNTLKEIGELKRKVSTARETQRRVAHDIRGPIGGIIGLARMISEQGEGNSMDEVLEFINLIHKSGNSILELADEILSAELPKKGQELASNEFNLLVLKERLEKLYTLQARNKNVRFDVNTTSATEIIPFRKNKILQIVGNIVSNAIKFTPDGGRVTVSLALVDSGAGNELEVRIRDTGIGMDAKQVNAILQGEMSSNDGTAGEQGYGFGLRLVKHLVDSLSGKMTISSEPGSGTLFTVTLPQGTD